VKKSISWIIIITMVMVVSILNDCKAAFKDNTPPPASAPVLGTHNDITVEAAAAVLMEQTTGKILYSRNPHEIMYPASTTKILTTLVALENSDTQDTVTVGEEVKAVPNHSTVAGLIPGQTYSMSDLLLALMLPSGNDAANAIAVYIARRVKDESLDTDEAMVEFCRMMNQRAREIGAFRSNFVNPHGYHDNNHYTTAYDLALIAREAMNNPAFRRLVRTPHAVVEKPAVVDKAAEQSDTSDQPDEVCIHRWTNGNRLLNRTSKDYYFPYATGIKTGFTTPAGHCLVSSAFKDGLEVISVVLKSTQEGRWVDSRKLLEYGLNDCTFHQLLKKGDILCTLNVTNHAQDEPGQVNVIAAEDYRDIFDNEDIPKIQSTIVWNDDLLKDVGDNRENILLSAPVFKGQKLGRIVYTLDKVLIKQIDLVADRDIEAKLQPDMENTNTLPLGKHPNTVFVIGLLIICPGIFFTVRRLKARS